jgi:hypothetical protein
VSSSTSRLRKRVELLDGSGYRPQTTEGGSWALAQFGSGLAGCLARGLVLTDETPIIHACRVDLVQP